MEDERLRLWHGVRAVFRVDPYSNQIINLYLPKDIRDYLMKRFNGIHMTVTTRYLFELPGDSIEHILEKEPEFPWKKED